MNNRSRHNARKSTARDSVDTKITRSRKVMDLVLVIIALIVVAFTVTMIIVYVKTGGVPDTLIGCVFAACTGELGVMGWIKNTKEKYLNRELEQADSAVPDPLPNQEVLDAKPTQSATRRYEEVNFFE